MTRYVNCRYCAADVIPHTQCGCCGKRHLPRQCDRFRMKTRWLCHLNGDRMTVKSGFDHDGRMQVIWDSAPNYIADVWSWEVTPMKLARLMGEDK